MEKLNKYESVTILRGDLKDKKYQNALNNVIDYMKPLVNFERIEEIGLKNMAYEIKNYKKGWYVCYYFEATSDNIIELERLYRIDDNILKFIVVKKDD